MVRIEQLSDLETAKQVATLLEAENARLHQRLEAPVAENARLKGEDAQAHLQLELTQLKEQLALLQQRLFGASSGKRVDKPPKPLRLRIEALAQHLQKSYEALLAEIFTSSLIHADETHGYLLDKGPGTKWYAWTVASPDTVFHRIYPSRSGATARMVLGDYEGIVLVGRLTLLVVTKC